MPDHLHPTDIDQYLFCRVCFCGPDLVLNEGGQLISPCSCSGSVRHVHLHCLRTWQATQRAQGRSQKSHSCELCGSKYVISEELLQRERRQSSCVERVYSGLKRAWQWCNDTAQGPVWQEALRYWRNALLVRLLRWLAHFIMVEACVIPLNNLLYRLRVCTRQHCGELLA